MFTWNIPFLGRPILWYGFFFAVGFILAYLLFRYLLGVYMHAHRASHESIVQMSERIPIYVIIGMLIGSRLGDVLFYQSPHQYFHDPLRIFFFWDGGLSSHGGVFGILLALLLLASRRENKFRMLTWTVLLDLIALPALIAGIFIRIGNFFNQEIIGVASSMPWAVTFGHPLDGSAAIPRHPVQLYEAIIYLAIFVILWLLREFVPSMSRSGKTSGLFFMGTFGLRFLIEWVKVPQSELLHPDTFLNMGQILSIPLILLGAALFFVPKDRRRTRSVERN